MKTNLRLAVAVAVLAAITVVSTAQGQTAIPKVKPIAPVKPIPKVCNPNAWGDYLRKKRVVDELLDDWLKRSIAARHKFRDDFWNILLDQRKEDKQNKKVQKKVAKMEKEYMDYIESRYSTTEAALEKDAAAARIGAEEAAFEAGVLVQLLFDAAELDMAYGNYRDELAANDKDLQRVDALWQSALADLRQALSQSEACKRDRDKADADEALKEKARAMIEKWNIDGRSVYRDPHGVTLDERAALEEAKQILLGQRSGSRRVPAAVGLRYVQLGPAVSTSGAQQAAAALIRVQRAHGFFRRSMAAIIAFMDAQEQFEQSVAEIRRGN